MRQITTGAQLDAAIKRQESLQADLARVKEMFSAVMKGKFASSVAERICGAMEADMLLTCQVLSRRIDRMQRLIDGCGEAALIPVLIDGKTIAFAGSKAAAGKFHTVYVSLTNGTPAGDAWAWQHAAYLLLDFGNMAETQRANDSLRPPAAHSYFGHNGWECRFVVNSTEEA